MTRKLVATLLMATVLLAVPVALAEDTIESIEKAVVEQWDKLTSVCASLALNADFPMNIVASLISKKEPDPANKAVGKLVINGPVDYQKKDGKVASRLELNAALNEALKARALFVSDGTNANLEYEYFGKVETKKIEQADMAPPGGKALFDYLKQEFNLAAQPAEKVNDKDAYVLDATLKTPDPSIPISKLRFYFAKDSGVLLKGIVYNAENAPFATLLVNDIKLNTPIPDDRFKYTPPAPPAPPAAPAPAAAPSASAPAPAVKK